MHQMNDSDQASSQREIAPDSECEEDDGHDRFCTLNGLRNLEIRDSEDLQDEAWNGLSREGKKSYNLFLAFLINTKICTCLCSVSPAYWRKRLLPLRK